MESKLDEFTQLIENPDMTVGSTSNNLTYVSCIKINGKPILPPLITEERRNELQKFKQRAIAMELKLSKQKKKNSTKSNHISSEVSSLVNVPPSRQSTPARPATLCLSGKSIGKTFVLSKSKTEGCLQQFAKNGSVEYEMKSSQQSAKKLDRTFRSTLEQRLASDDRTLAMNKINKYQQSPIIEEKYVDSDSDSKKGRKMWSPLEIDSLNSLRIELTNKESQETDENLELRLDECQTTPDTVTHSPSLMRQNSYTLLTPSPALLNFLESRKEQENIQRSQSGRKTWDLTTAKKKWDPNTEKLCKSPSEYSNDESDMQYLNKKNSSSLDSFSALQSSFHKDAEYNEYSLPNSLPYDSGTSPDSYSSKRSFPKLAKIKCKIKGKKLKSKSVPSPKSTEKVPFKDSSISTQGTPQDFVPLSVKTELSELSNLLLKMKMDHERQKKELEEKQQSEMKQLEIIFQRKEAELLDKVRHMPRTSTKSIYTQSSRDSLPRAAAEIDPQMMGDGNHNRTENLINDRLNHYVHSRRPHSAKDFHPQVYSYDNDCNRRTRSMDFNQANQDTDLDVSFQDDFMHSKDTTLNNDYVIESDSVSNFSSHSSSHSSENRRDLIPPTVYKKFQGISSEEYAKYNQAATKITAAARGFLTRRLLRTAHVQGLSTTLKDAINCATQLHSASDIGDSDIDLMRRLGRQIEAAWDALYAVFFNTDTTTKLQLIANDRERLRAIVAKASGLSAKKKRISSATEKSLNRKKVGSLMSKSQTSNGFTRVRKCSKMTASYPSPSFSSQKLK